jgi:magnesium-transporting ATPase (P-type)
MACESASLVITNDDFSTIVKAIAHGRITYDNIQRCVAYLLTASATSVLVIAFGIITNSGLLMRPLQLLALNLIMHVFPALGIVVQTYDRGLMTQPPRDRRAKILGWNETLQIMVRSIIISIVVLVCVLRGTFTAAHAPTAVLFAVSLNLVIQSWLWLAKPTKPSSLLNAPMAICTVLALIILLASIYWAPLAAALNTVPLTAAELRSVGMSTLLIVLCTNLLGGKRKQIAPSR